MVAPSTALPFTASERSDDGEVEPNPATPEWYEIPDTESDATERPPVKVEVAAP